MNQKNQFRCYKNTLVACMAALILAFSSASFGWGSAGHMAVGNLADQLIKGSPAEAHVKSILGTDGTLKDAAIWPDCAKYIQPKQDFKYIPDKRYYDKACAIYESDEGKTEMAAYVRRNNDNCEYGGARQNCHKAYHFTDIPIQEDHYEAGYTGGTDSDVIHAINAAIAVLQGFPVPAPFNIPSDAGGRLEALRLLAHFVGDIHQPLHVGAIYLNKNGQPVNPDKTGYDPTTNTVGGNSLKVGASSELHGEWDKITSSLANEDLTDDASKIHVTQGPLENWAATWASESVLLAQTAYSGLSFGTKESGETPNSFDWPISFDNRSNYLKTERGIQRKQIIKAGARLAEVLKAIWPD